MLCQIENRIDLYNKQVLVIPELSADPPWESVDVIHDINEFLTVHKCLLIIDNVLELHRHDGNYHVEQNHEIHQRSKEEDNPEEPLVG